MQKEFLNKFNLIKALETQRTSLLVNSMTVSVISQLDELLDSLDGPIDRILENIGAATSLLETFSSFMDNHLSRILLDPSVVVQVSAFNQQLADKLSILTTIDSISSLTPGIFDSLIDYVQSVNDEIHAFDNLIRTVEGGKWQKVIKGISLNATEIDALLT